MKKLSLLLVVFLVAIGCATPVQSDDEPAKYNFASAQGSHNLQITPGSEGAGEIYFYNIDGNRITHVALVVAAAPDGWDVSIDPALADTEVLVNQAPVTVTENLYVEPSELLAEEPGDVPDGMVSIWIAKLDGYALGKLARIIVRVPDGASIGTTGTIGISAEAFWLGQSGSAAMKQARDFEFTVTVVSGESGYSEEIVGTGAGDSENDTGSGIPFWVWIIVGVMAVIIATLLVRRRHD